MSLMKEGKIECAIVLRAHSMVIEVCERTAQRFPSALKHLQIRDVGSAWSDDQIRREIDVEPPATVEFFFFSTNFAQ